MVLYSHDQIIVCKDNKLGRCAVVAPAGNVHVFNSGVHVWVSVRMCAQRVSAGWTENLQITMLIGYYSPFRKR